MVEVVVSFAQCDERGQDVIAGAVAVVKGLVTEPVGQGVDTKGGLLNDKDSQNTGIDETTNPVTPAKPGNKSREDEGHEEDGLDKVPVLPDDDGVLVEVGDIGAAGALGVLLDDHPANMAVQQTLPHGVGVLFGVGVSVMGAMTLGPPTGRTLHGTSTNSSEVNTEGEASLVTPMSPKTMVTGGDTKASVVVVWITGQYQRQALVSLDKNR